MITKIRKLLPFSYEMIIKRLLGSGKTVLDVGCGDGQLMAFLNSQKELEVTGVDGHKPFLKLADKLGVYKELILKDVREIELSPQSFDIVVCSQVLEYLTLEEGLALIGKLEKIAKNRVILAAYIGDCAHSNAQDNPLQTSRGVWHPQDLIKRGYQVYGQGLRLVYQENGYNPKKLKGWDYIPIAFSTLISPLVYYSPQIATHMIAVKDIKKAKG